LRYKPWGETRYNSGNTPTRYQYTGQYSYTADFGLYFYNARWYDPTLGRFTQPDSLIPEQSQGAQAWDRYAYVNNNPLKYTDPSGHWLETAWDILNIAWDIHEIRQDPGNLWNWGALVVDVGTALLPGVPAFAGVVSKGGKALARTDDILDMVRAVSWTERFAGASPEVRRGIAWLEKMVQDERIPDSYRRGFAAELLRAEEYYKAGKLQAVEAVVERGRVDLILVTDEIVEVKYWTQSHTEANFKKLTEQLTKYQATGRPILLELFRTKTDPITEGYIKDLLQRLQAAGVQIMREQIRLVEWR
jgi:RHS repeat-associated protein